VVDEHVGHGPAGLIAPAFYLAPQRRDVAAAGWNFGAMLSGAASDGPIIGMNNPQLAVMLLQLAGEFADAATKQRIWTAADEHIEPTWDVDAGEFTLGFGLGEEHPRGQWNARAMAGWVATEGAWSRIFNQPNLTKFGESLHLAAHPQNATVRGTRTAMTVTNLPPRRAWSLVAPDGTTTPVEVTANDRGGLRQAGAALELVADGAVYRLTAKP